MHSTDAGISERYYIAKDAHACVSSGSVVFLDLNSGRYLTLQQRAANSLSGHVDGWPISEDVAGKDRMNSRQTVQLLKQLEQKHLLTTRMDANTKRPRAAVSTPTATLLDAIHLQPPEIRAHHVTTFLLCCYRARAYLRWRGIKKVIERAQRQLAAVPATSDRSDPERTRTLTAIFHRLQPLALDGFDGCLLQSFAHREFLLFHGVVAQWVFGVRAVPFSAHCWLQQGNVVLNDVAQRAGYLSPILVV